MEKKSHVLPCHLQIWSPLAGVTQQRKKNIAVQTPLMHLGWQVGV